MNIQKAVDALEVIKLLEDQVRAQDEYIRLLEKRINKIREEVVPRVVDLRISGGGRKDRVGRKQKGS